MRVSFLLSFFLIGFFFCVGKPALGGPKLSVSKSTPLRELPFWRANPRLIEKMRGEDREVVVSVTRSQVKRGGEELESFRMLGGGYVRRSREFCYNISQQYEKLKEVDDHFHTVKYTASNQQLFVITQALGYQARMLLQMQPVSEDWRSEIQFEVIWGHFKGMKGWIGFERIEDRATEVSIRADYEAKELPLPKFLMGFVLEGITKKIAEKMRTFIESQPVLAADEGSDRRIASVTAPTPAKGPGLLRVPKGFAISVFIEDVPGARQMALSPEGTLYVGTQDKGVVYAVPGVIQAANTDKKPGKVRLIATQLNQPNGVAFRDGSLYVAEISRILRFDKIESLLKRTQKMPKPVVVKSDLPKDKWHGWKVLGFGPDGWLYVPIGAPCNLCVIADSNYAAINRMSRDGKKFETFARGVRNTVGFDWNPENGELWFTDNGADMMGDESPNDELNRAPKPGLNFGFPFCHQGDVRDPKFGEFQDCSKFEAPRALLGAHTASLGMKFYRGKMFPKEYRNRIFIAQHGSWNRSKKVGYRVVTVALEGPARARPPEVFAEGWLQGEDSWGRPVDILEMPDGSLLVSDDHDGKVYRITYQKNELTLVR